MSFMWSQQSDSRPFLPNEPGDRIASSNRDGLDFLRLIS
jgi:hypothetical protein